MSRYFDNDPSLPHEDCSYSFEIASRRFAISSDSGVFSKGGLDDGSRLLLETIVKTDLGTNILDLGCGIGPIGLVLACFDPRRHVVLADVNLRALQKAKENAIALGVESQVEVVESDVYSSLEKQTFSTIVTNPPIRAGKKVTYAMYAGALSHLNEGGRLILVIRKQQGASSCKAYLESLYSKVELAAQKKGYRILIATK